MPQKLVTVTTLHQLEELKSYLQDKTLIALDCETTGVEKESQVIGFSVCAEVGEVDIGYYVVLAYWSVEEQKLIWLETLQGAKDFFLFLQQKQLAMQNGVFDCAMIMNNFGVQLIGSLVVDTLVLGHLLNENRQNGLKERGVELFGEDARAEQIAMRASVYRNGGVLTKEKYELYKADMDLMAHYGAKDAILTMNVLCHDLPLLEQEGLSDFFFKDESMPLFIGPTYDLNTVGLRVDTERLSKLKGELEAQIMENEAAILRDIDQHIKDKYPGTSKRTIFNLNSNQQLVWLLFDKLENEFHMLTKAARELCKETGIKVPYSNADKRAWIELILSKKGQVWRETRWNYKTKRYEKPKVVQHPLKYMSVGKETCLKFSHKYRWVATLIELAKARKLLNTYVIGIQSRMKYGIIRPSFLQNGTTSGRYSSRNPNFQNLPRGDKRVKACIIARPGKVFIGADYAQLEPRVFAAQSQDERLMRCFDSGEDFYSVVGAPIFDTEGKSTSLVKEALGSFSTLFPEERQIAKEDVALASVYGTTKYKMSVSIDRTPEECQEIIDLYFSNFPKVYQFMLDSHKQAKEAGVVYNMFGRPRRMPRAMDIPKLFGDVDHADLEYKWRNILNLAVNHRVQSTGASIINRAAIAFHRSCRELIAQDPAWGEVKVVLQCHDELVAESPKHIALQAARVLKDAMENTTHLPGVSLLTEPKIGYTLAELK